MKTSTASINMKSHDAAVARRVSSRAVYSSQKRSKGAAVSVRHTPVRWSVPDFSGTYHAKSAVDESALPGTAVKLDKARFAFVQQRQRERDAQLAEIAINHERKGRSRARKAAIVARVLVQTTVGEKLAVASAALDEVERRGRASTLSAAAPDAGFAHFIQLVESNAVPQVRYFLRSSRGRCYINTADSERANTALHRAAALGLTGMVEALLEVSHVSSFTNEPLHCKRCAVSAAQKKNMPASMLDVSSCSLMMLVVLRCTIYNQLY
jgi:hypothetical protein